MIISDYGFLDTPALLIDREQALRNIRMMQDKADAAGVKLRPHTKTHRMPYFAKLQMEAGACGIAVSKVGEAEVMAQNGLTDIFVANEIVGEMKLERVRALHQKVKIRIGVDSAFQIDQIEEVFQGEEKPLEVLIELEVGENRSGVITDEQLVSLTDYIKTKKHVSLKGIFSHEGHTYKAESREACADLAKVSYERTVRAANLIRSRGVEIDTVSVGATPSLMNGAVIEGVTEMRPGTYIFMDLGQAGGIGSFERCAATVLTTVISKPTGERVVLDAGAKALVSQNRMGGICSTNGFGYIKGSDNVRVEALFDEHGLIYHKGFHDSIRLGDKIEVIPSHICPTVNLYDKAYLVSEGKVLEELPILCRGKSQ